MNNNMNLNKEICMETLKHHPDSFKDLWNRSYDIAMYALSFPGNTRQLEYMTNELKMNKDIVKQALKNPGDNELKFTNNISLSGTGYGKIVYVYVTDEMKNDKDIAAHCTDSMKSMDEILNNITGEVIKSIEELIDTIKDEPDD
jgi:hypothetical protein